MLTIIAIDFEIKLLQQLQPDDFLPVLVVYLDGLPRNHLERGVVHFYLDDHYEKLNLKVRL